MEEMFFFIYHMGMDWRAFLQLPINARKWLVDKFIDQKNRENEAFEAAKRRKR
jgi:hypothetical protein